MSDQLLDIGKDILNETIKGLKDQYASIPASVKGVMPRAAALVAKAAISGGLTGQEASDLAHALMLMANVKVGAQIALNELMLQAAEDILARGFNFVRKLVGI